MEFIEQEESDQMPFPSTLNANERRIIHEASVKVSPLTGNSSQAVDTSHYADVHMAIILLVVTRMYAHAKVTNYRI